MEVDKCPHCESEEIEAIADGAYLCQECDREFTVEMFLNEYSEMSMNEPDDFMEDETMSV